eukprot:CAMPEP_0174380196 /NCGR_PEP_ID=MMETSP0811_2-20130205/123211_1 /TAXON_ID=73025 ORGANISM="Eutreptiella gymnastica-like, Strain CCMP1594" /NCGR_SAMPLE_ID=MMETSP0811_2 /ASSEMBLY_ACC=CAM_ASM_000667 /LENGTH=31 /DNA_ID= /DNA_START= /DNA_END= /DNA_ORIENTATION=
MALWGLGFFFAPPMGSWMGFSAGCASPTEAV